MENHLHRNIVHVDLDTFFVSVECLKNSKLKGKPLLVGGSSDRAVVAACSYEARRFGIHSAMPMKLARRLCPQAVIISGDFEDYSKYSKVVTDIIAEKVPVYEKASIDEFYIDMSGMEKFYGCSVFSADLKKCILQETGLPVSYALASNKLVSKVATNEAKPDGGWVIKHGGERSFLAPLAIEKMPMVGDQTGRLLRSMGVETIKTLSEIPPRYLENLLGRNGIELSRRAKGIDETPVHPYRDQKGISKENTFSNDTIDTVFLNSELTRMTETIGFELRKQNRLAGNISVKLRYANFDTVSRQVSIPYTSSDHIFLQKAKGLFQQLYDRRMLIRLIGVRLTNLVPGNYQISLFDDTAEMINLYQSIDHIKNRFGSQLLMRASGMPR